MNSKDMNEEGSKAELLANNCEKLDSKTYISPVGSKVYLKQSDSFKRRGIEVKYNNFRNPVYNQLGGEFIPYMSVIDLIFNEVPKSIEIIHKGIVKNKAYIPILLAVKLVLIKDMLLTQVLTDKFAL